MLEKKELKLLHELMKDSRQKITELAQKSRLTRQSVYDKLAEFKLRGIRFTIDIPPKDLGLNLVAYVLIEADPHKEFRKETDYLIKRFKEISQIHYTLGRSDVLAEVVVRNIDEFRSVLNRIQNLPAVRKTETLMVYESTNKDRLDPFLKVLKEDLKNT